MAKRFLSSLRLVTLSSDPEFASNGDVYYNSELGRTKFYQNNSWAVIPELLEDLSDISASGLANGDVLTYNSASAIWTNGKIGTSIDAGDTFPESPVQGSLFFKVSNLTLYVYVSGAWFETGSTPPFDGGLAGTLEFDGGIDGGEPGSTFIGTISGGSVIQDHLLA